MIPVQNDNTKKAEVFFRKKLVKQHKGLKTYYKWTTNNQSILEWLKGRLEVTDNIFKVISQKYTLSPFLEIGAEKSERSGILESKYNQRGIALDISYDSLESVDFFFPKIGLSKKPLRVCADANNLPFLNNSFAFVFCFQALHHFPHPKPIMEEIKRVMRKDGIFYFGEEPVNQDINLNLWRRDYHLKPWEKLLKYTLILPFISKIGKVEVDHGVLEETPTLKQWEEALSIFPYAEVKLLTYPEFVAKHELKKPKTSKNWLKVPFPKSIIFKILGGGINVLAKKELFSKQKVNKKQKVNLLNFVACPICKNKLISKELQLNCSICGQSYPIKNNILMLIPLPQRKKWYGM